MDDNKMKKNMTNPDTMAGPSQASWAVKRSVQQTGDNNDDLAASMEPTRPAKSAKQYDVSNVKSLPLVVAKTAAHSGNSMHLTHSGLACHLNSSHQSIIKPVFQQVLLSTLLTNLQYLAYRTRKQHYCELHYHCALMTDVRIMIGHTEERSNREM
jgi:hypothetical protein